MIEYGTTAILPVAIAHNSCNLKYRKPKSISVFFHNLSGYDSHLFIKKLGSPDKKENIDYTKQRRKIYKL